MRRAMAGLIVACDALVDWCSGLLDEGYRGEMECIIAKIFGSEAQKEAAIELFHGYTYSSHPTACAAGLAALSIYEREGLFQRVKDIAPYWQDAVHSLKGLPGVIDIRNYGLVAAIEYEPIAGSPGARGFQTFLKSYDAGILVRAAGDVTCMSPPLIIEKSQIDELVGTLGKVIKTF